MEYPDDTIAALATPPGRGGVGIIRVSGAGVKFIIQTVLNQDLIPRKACLLPFLDENGQTLDSGIAIFFKGPHSFTGEDVLELHGHGGPIVLDLVLKRVLSCDVRIAKPGEFSQRAFLNDKIDLAQAEAVADLINASTEQAARMATRSLQGEFSQEVNGIFESLVHLRMYVESAIDFPEEEIDFLNDSSISEGISSVITDLNRLLANAQQGALLQEGYNIVIAGRPNAGKSSLLNALAKRETAIVTELPGTTRDVIREQITIDGLPINIIDTAGIRKSDNLVEKIGIERAHQEIKQADLVLIVIDSSANKREDLHHIIDEIPEGLPILIAFNKCDLSQESPRLEKMDQRDAVHLSVKHHQGLDLLKSLIKKYAGYDSEQPGLFLARRRHIEALTETLEHVYRGQDVYQNNKSGELLAEELRLAQHSLSEITGTFSTEDLLGRIFSSFCIGK